MDSPTSKIVKYEEPDSHIENLEQNNLLEQLRQISILEYCDLEREKLNILITNIKNIDENIACSRISLDFCQELFVLVNDGKTAIEQAMIRLARTIAELGFDLACRFENNKFYDLANKSGLLQKIIDIFKPQVENQAGKKKKYYSVFAVQLVQAICLFSYHVNLDKQACMLYGKVLIQDIQRFIKQLKQRSKEYKGSIPISKQKEIIIENEIKDGILTLKALNTLIRNISCSNYFVNERKLHELISKFLHINCPSEISCNQRLSLPESVAVLNTKGIICQIFVELLIQLEYFHYYLQSQHDIILHISPLIISFAFSQLQSEHSNQSNLVLLYKQQINSTTNLCNQLQFIIIPQTVIVSCLYLIYLLLQKVRRLDDKQYLLMPSLVGAFVILSQYKKERTNNDLQDEQSKRIRVFSNDCLLNILQVVNLEIQEKMINEWKVINAFMNSISTAGGCLEEDDDLISRTFGDVIGVSYKLSKKKVKQYPDSVLDIRMKEEIELEGGLEEIEANIYHLLEKINDDVQEQALETKNEINNTYKEGSNRNEDDEESDSFSEDIQDDLNDEIGEVLVNVGYFPLNRIFKDSDQ